MTPTNQPKECAVSRDCMYIHMSEKIEYTLKNYETSLPIQRAIALKSISLSTKFNKWSEFTKLWLTDCARLHFILISMCGGTFYYRARWYKTNERTSTQPTRSTCHVTAVQWPAFNDTTTNNTIPKWYDRIVSKVWGSVGHLNLT